MKAKKLIEVALPIKEISAESVRDKSIRHGHISTIHLWWARRPLPVCRAVVFSSLVPDPLDKDCPIAFKDALQALLCSPNDTMSQTEYAPYPDIPYTAVYDPMEDNLRNRLLMFIGKFSEKCQENMKKGISTPAKDQLIDSCLIKCENKNNPRVLRIARELIWVAFNSEKNPQIGYETLHKQFNFAYNKIGELEECLYSAVDRHLNGAEMSDIKEQLDNAILDFVNNMPSVFDPFAGGGAIPLEAARLGCRSFGNDINPVAHIIEKCSVEFPQKFGKPIVYSKYEFEKKYGKEGLDLATQKNINLATDGYWHIPNRLSFDFEYFALKLIESTKARTSELYFIEGDKRPSVYYWMKFAKCSNSSCACDVPLFKQYYLSKPRTNKKASRIKHFRIDSATHNISINNGLCDYEPTVKRGNMCCPYCKSITDIYNLKKQFEDKSIKEKMIGIVYDTKNGKVFHEVEKQCQDVFDRIPVPEIPSEKLQPNSAGGDILGWGFSKWGELFNKRQLTVLYAFCDELKKISVGSGNDEYDKVITTYLALLIDRIAVRMSSFGKWHILQDTVEHLFGRQAIQMNFDYPEMDPFSTISSSAYGQMDSIISYINEEGFCPFTSEVKNVSSGDKLLFDKKSITAVVTDPPYYDAIAYADISDFFYVWLKRNLRELYPLTFSTPQTPKSEECTALKHHHGNNELQANEFFENKLQQIFDAIEMQTTDVVSVMFAHQSTKAWTTLCNSILESRMNITGSWPMDTEVSGALKTDKAFLESSVTVACRPSERRGYGDYKDVKYNIETKVTEEVESLYELGFRGADLLTACFGQAVSEFGLYKTVEKADGSEVSVGELLEMARSSAFDALLKGVQGDDYTKFYIGWLQLNGTGDVDFDDATKFTRVGVNVDINDIKHKRLLILEGNKMHLAMAKEHLTNSGAEGCRPTDTLISQAHRAILLYRQSDRGQILAFVRDIAPDSTSPLWRLLATLKELLPAGEDAKDVQGFLQNAEDFRQNCQKEIQYTQRSLFDSTFDDTFN